ncbi:unnamed protein product [Albugo candida]|uniref:Uncharacterized protein n=2 Tax=Albugo candida TaxID=65357 RepID=A0A024G0Z0_9STRA|nr:unnamed protein product [Albugo candida]|eukprot:CCI40512.1 unnamed protein product [Albugo candida]
MIDHRFIDCGIPTQKDDTLRQLGNAAFSRKDYMTACFHYNQAIIQEPHNPLIYSNRAAARMYLNQLTEALQDADIAVSLAPEWPKGHYRKSQILEKLDRHEEAKVSHKRFRQLHNDDHKTAKNFGSNRRGEAVSRGFLNGVGASKGQGIYSEKDAVSMTKEKDSELKWTRMLRRLKEACNASGRNEKGQSVVLNHGLFGKLLQKDEFQKFIYPGISKKELVHAPKTLQEVLLDPMYEAELMEVMPKIVQKGENVLNNVKQKGAAQGEFMDVDTEKILWPQVLQEAFARELVSIIQRINSKKHLLLANDTRLIAHTDDTQGEYYDTISTACLQLLSDSGIAIIDGYMGNEWKQLLHNDVKRMVTNAMFLENCSVEGDQHLTRKFTCEKTQPKRPQICFVERKSCDNDYPAIGELLCQMYKIPFEINRKRHESSNLGLRSISTLCAPFPHSTLLQRYRQGQTQPLRRDCGNPPNDNGIKLTCIYCIASPEISNAVLHLRPDSRAQNQLEKEYTIIPDRLVIFDSAKFLNEISPFESSEEDLFLLTFWIHGCNPASQP